MGKSTRRHWWWGVVVVNLLAVAVYLTSARDSAWQVGAYLVPPVLAVGLLAARLRAVPAAQRGPLPALLVAQAGYLVATVFWYPVPVASGQELPFPSFVDGLFLTAYGAFAVFLLLVLRLRTGDRITQSRIALTDALILAASMSSVLWVAVVAPNLTAGASPLATTVAVLYPVATLSLFVLAARLAVAGDLRGSVPGALLLLWISVEILGDTVYGMQGVAGTFEHGSLLSLTWMVASSAVGALAVHPGTVALLGAAAAPVRGPAPAPGARTGPAGLPATGPRRRTARLATLLGAALLSPVMMFVDEGRSPFLLGASIVAVTLVIIRTSLLAGDLDRERRLAAELDAAVRQMRHQHLRLEDQSVELERLAFRDPVTGLGNRALLRQRSESVGFSLARTTMLLLDLDGFKEVNDTLGHAAGDLLLLEVGVRLGRCVRADDTVVRLGGDEFALLLTDTGPAAAMHTADRVLAALRDPFYVEKAAVRVQGSIGVASGAIVEDMGELLRNADLAMYEAKGAGKDRSCSFDPVMYTEATRRVRLDGEIRSGLEQGDFTVHYQPIVDAFTGEVRSLEALVRWRHPERGVLPPAEFLPAAERTGQIVELGRLVVRTACADVARWRLDRPDLVVAVNVSHQELMYPGFSEHVGEVLAETGLPPGALQLEVTETVLADESSIAQILGPLADLGVLFSIDDFGTGHSSLSRIRGWQASRLKIDRSFIAEISEGPHEDAPLISSIISLAHSIGHMVVAEGVETLQQAAFLTAHGCDELQGYLFSRPVASDGVPAVLAAAGRPVAAPVEHGR